MVTSTKETGLTTRQRAMVPTVMQMEHTMMVNGLMINNMDMERNHGLMVLGMKDIILRERKKEKES